MSTYNPRKKADSASNDLPTTGPPSHRAIYNAIHLPTTFNLLRYKHFSSKSFSSRPENPTRSGLPSDPASNSSNTSLNSNSSLQFGSSKYARSMDLMEKQLLNRLNFRTFNSDSILVINAVLALTAYYMRSNCLKAFSNFGSNDPQQIQNYQQFRNFLIKISAKYYGIAIHKLRTMLSRKDYNVTIAIIVLSFMNKISIYEDADLNQSVTFSKGVIGIFNDILSNFKQSNARFLRLFNISNESSYTSANDVSWIINFLVFASKSIFFPTYDPTILLEYNQTLIEYRDILHELNRQGIQPSQHVIFNFNHLFSYTQQLLLFIQSHNTNNINQYPILLYKLLRHWLIILPSKVHVLEYLSDPLEKTLMYLFRTLTKILDNLFPSVIFYFLHTFSGGLSLWYEPNYELDPKIVTPQEMSSFPTPIQHHLIRITIYSVRVCTFFQKRSNILLIFFGDQRLKQELSPQIIQANINEVMIKAFKKTKIRLYHYIHLPNVVQFTKTNVIFDNIQQRFGAKMLYYYNQGHYDHFMSKNSDKSYNNVFKKDSIDPIINFHMNNISQSGFETANDNKRFGSMDGSSSFSSSTTASPPDTGRSVPVSLPFTTTMGSSAPINYYTIFEDNFSLILTKKLSQEYEDLFRSGDNSLFVNPDSAPFLDLQLNPQNRLFFGDNDPLRIAEISTDIIFKRRLQNLFTNTEIYNLIVNLHNTRNRRLSAIMSEPASTISISRQPSVTSTNVQLMESIHHEIEVEHRENIKNVRKRSGSKSKKKISPEESPVEKVQEKLSDVDNFYDDLNEKYFAL